ncbi:NADPH:quinone reductase [Amycolatopsis sp. PS_44_ISF1]|uniref:NADPH:quinone reductase n=1 Tax=Amycolatopsis sp. PS_44_ISF1 TaxID=2974917 RepID=UPI0028DE2EEA|nr:NADPH:quinone reductase [Amycolatopsis sp. PS_44_ISF1]MDT8912541.1 NADPH:quinone reductase [Amycolatopsis sp. PS_44_ISF1]
MRAVTYRSTGGPEVLTLSGREAAEPGAGEVRVRVVVSAVNPTDVKQRRGSGLVTADGTGPTVPHQDGAGVVDAVGPGVTGLAAGDRVWLILAAAHGPASGSAQEYTVLPAERVFPLPEGAGFDEGAGFGIPGLTAHRALTVAEGGPERLTPGALDGVTVLVAGGAGAVGNSAVQLARWAGATVISTVSTEAKAELARAAGAHHVLRYTEPGLEDAIKRLAPGGVDLIVEVAAGVNAELDSKVLRPLGTIAVYGDDGGDGTVRLSFPANAWANTRYQFVILYTLGTERLRLGAEAVSAAIADGALVLGEKAGVPVHRFPLEETARAHAAAEQGAVGKVLIDVTPAG